MPSKKRNFRKEYDNYQGKPEQIARRSSRNRARRALEKAGVAKKGDGLDVGHKNGSPLQNARSNLKLETKKANRSYPRTRSARKRNPKD